MLIPFASLFKATWQHQQAPRSCCYTSNFHCRSYFRPWEVLLNVSQVSSSLIGQWISHIFSVVTSNMIQESVECAGPRQHSGESLVFIHCVVLKIQLSRYS